MQRELRITGEGRLSISPDIVVIRLPIEAKAKDYEATIDELNRIVGLVHKILQNNDIDKKMLKTTDFHINEEWHHYKDKRLKPKVVGYKASHDLKLEIPFDNSLIAAVLNDIAKSGTGISFTLSFDVSEKQQYNKELIKNAVEDAKASAEVIALASGVALKEIVNIDFSFSEINFHNDNFDYESNFLMCEDSSMPDFSPDEISAKKNITITWIIQ